MSRNKLFGSAGLRFTAHSLICCFIGILAMSKDSIADEPWADQEAVEIDSLPRHELGGNSVTVWLSNGMARLSLSNTLDMKYKGVGLVETQVSDYDQKRAKELHDELCKAAIEKPKADIDVDPEMTYALRCMRDGKLETYSGQFRDLTRELWSLSIGFKQSILGKYEGGGRSIVKFDARVSDVRREKDKFVVAIKFVNSGRFPIKMATPDMWEKLAGRRLDISGFRVGGGGEWRANLAGVPLMNKDEYPVETTTTMGEARTSVTIPAGESVTYKFLTIPEGKVPSGQYEFSALVYSSIHVSGVNGAGGTVNFMSDKSSAPVTFDTDFPSTPQEWKDYEERERGKRSEQGIKPGHKFAETAHYRLVSDTGQRSRWVYTFHKGETGVETYDEKGKPFPGKPVWKWVGDYSVPVCCDPGAPCPRDGRWAGCTFGYKLSMADEYVIHEERSFKAGEIMPPVIGYGGREVLNAHWKWLGA